jgi:hypothetical protein
LLLETPFPVVLVLGTALLGILVPGVGGESFSFGWVAFRAADEADSFGCDCCC